MALAPGDRITVTGIENAGEPARFDFIRFEPVSPPLPILSIAAGPNGAEAGPVNGAFTVSLSAAVSVATTVGYTVSGTATAGSDYTALSGSVTINAGQTSATINVPVLDDALSDPNETVTVSLTGITAGDPNVVIGATNSATITIIDDDVAVTPITIQAEAIASLPGGSVTVYRPESDTDASGGSMLSLLGGAAGETGTASFNFTGGAANYNVILGSFDENDGVATLQVAKNGASIGSVQLNQNKGSNAATAATKVSLQLATGVAIAPGDRITITGIENAGEPARFDFIRFEPVSTLPPPGAAKLGITESSDFIQKSNFGINSFQLTNVGGKAISKVVIDVTNALYPDTVFDPFGLAGDTAFKALTIDTNGDTGIIAPNTATTYIGTGGIKGYEGIQLLFDAAVNGGFQPGETVGFSIDMDPNSVAGSSKSTLDAGSDPAWDVGGVSGAELIGSSFTVTFTDGTSATGQIQGAKNQAGSKGLASQDSPNQTVSLTVNGLGAGGVGTYSSSAPSVIVNGPAGKTARVVLTKGIIQPVNNNFTEPYKSQFQSQLDSLAASAFPANNAANFQTVDVLLTGSAQNITSLFNFTEVPGYVLAVNEAQVPLGFVASVIDPSNDDLPLGPVTAPIYLRYNDPTLTAQAADISNESITALPADQQEPSFYNLKDLGLKPRSLGLSRNQLSPELTSTRDGRLLVGTDRADTISGGTDGELLVGLAGNDRLTGAGGKDILAGGKGADTFVIAALSDSAAGAANRDLISDFQGRKGDRIDLSGLDANSNLEGRQAFRYIGAKPFSGQAGELRYSAGGRLQGDVNGDQKPDLALELLGNPKFQASWLLL